MALQSDQSREGSEKRAQESRSRTRRRRDVYLCACALDVRVAGWEENLGRQN